MFLFLLSFCFSYLINKKEVEGQIINNEFIIGSGRKNKPAVEISEEFKIPSTFRFDGKDIPITTIADYGFYGTNIPFIVLSQNIQRIGLYSFANCQKLKYVDLSASNVTILSTGAFFNCTQLTNINYPPTVDHIGSKVFSFTKLTTLKFCESLVEISPHGFEDATIKLLNLKDTKITTFPENCFRGCTNLKLIEIPKTITEIHSFAFFQCSVLSLEFPSPLTNVAPHGFAGCLNIVSLNLSQCEMNCISEGVFEGCLSLKEVILPKNVTKYSNGAFSGNYMEYLEIPENILSIGRFCFSDCQRLKMVKAVSLDSIPEFAFKGCTSLIEIDLGNVTSIEEGAFAGCGFISISLNETIEVLDDFSFANCTFLQILDLTKINFNKIPKGLCRNCASLSTIVFNNNARLIGDGAFANTSLSFLNLSYTSISTLDDGCFSECRKLSTFIFPTELTVIGRGAFTSCPLLSLDFSQTNLVLIKKDAFKGTLVSYIKFSKVLEAIEGSAFENTKLESLIIPPSVIQLGSSSFAGCSFLGQADLAQSSITKLGSKCFSGCGKLSGAFLPPSLQEIGDSAFTRTALTSVFIPASVCRIGDSSFEGTPLGAIDLSRTSLIEIGSKSFSECALLRDAKIPPSLIKIGDKCFAETSMTKIDLFLTSVIIIPSGAFKGCSTLKAVELPHALQKIEDKAFEGSLIEKLLLPQSVNSLEGAFYGALKLSEISYCGKTDFSKANTSINPRAKVLVGSDYIFKTFGGINVTLTHACNAIEPGRAGKSTGITATATVTFIIGLLILGFLFIRRLPSANREDNEELLGDTPENVL